MFQQLIDWINPVNIDSTGKPLDYQLSNGLLLFYLTVASNFLGDLLSKPMQDLFSNNRMVKHLLGFVIMTYTITFAAGVESLWAALKFSIVLYVWFMLTTKLSLHWNLVILAILAVGFILDKYKKSLKDTPEQYLYTHLISNSMFMALIAVTAIGGIYNFALAQQSAGPGFSFWDFLLN